MTGKFPKLLPVLIASPIEELMLGSLLANPKDVIGSPPNPIMKMQLTRLWKEVLGAGDIGDFETFMNEASDLTYREAREKLLRTYGTPGRLHVRSAGDIEGAFHVQMCESAAEECDKGNPEACRVACQDCGITEFCPPQPKKPEPEVKPEPKETVKPIVHHVKPVVQDRRLAQRLADVTGMPVALPSTQEPVQKPRKALGKATQPEMRAKPSTVIKKIPRSGVIRITEKDIRVGKIVLEW